MTLMTTVFWGKLRECKINITIQREQMDSILKQKAICVICDTIYIHTR